MDVTQLGTTYLSIWPIGSDKQIQNRPATYLFDQQIQ